MTVRVDFLVDRLEVLMLSFPWPARQGVSRVLQGECAGRGFDLMFISSKETSAWPLSWPSHSGTQSQWVPEVAVRVQACSETRPVAGGHPPGHVSARRVMLC